MNETIVSKVEAFLASEVKTVEEAVIHLADLLSFHKEVSKEEAPVETIDASSDEAQPKHEAPVEAIDASSDEEQNKDTAPVEFVDGNSDPERSDTESQYPVKA